jgi:hypothetical protein
MQRTGIQNILIQSVCSACYYGSEENEIGSTINEILVADTNSESDAESSDLGDEFHESDEASEQEDEHQGATSGGVSPTWGLPQGRNIKIHPFVVLVRGLKKSEVQHINKDSSSLAALMLLYTEIFQLLVEQTKLYNQQQFDRQARPSRLLPDITLPDTVIFTALALQMAHVVKDTLIDYWSGLRQIETQFFGEIMT